MKSSFKSKDPLARTPIKYKLPLSFVLLFLTIFGLAGYLILNTIYHTLEREILSRLKNQAVAGTVILEKQLDNLRQRAADFASDGFIRKQVESIIPVHGTNRKSEAQMLLEKHLVENKLSIIDEFIDLKIYSNDGRLISSATNRRFAGMPGRQLFGSDDVMQFAEIWSAEELKRPVILIRTPVLKITRERRLGFLVCVVDLYQVLDQIVESQIVFGKTNDKQYMIISDKNYLRLSVPWQYFAAQTEGSSSLHSPNEFRLKLLDAKTSAPLADHEGKHICDGGRRRFGQSVFLNRAGWRVLVELDADRALRPVRVLESHLLGVALLVGLATLVLLYFPVQFVIRPLGALRDMALKIKEGDFSVRVPVQSEDEIGTLSRSFNLMADAVQHRTRSLEKMALDLQRQEKKVRLEHDRLQTVVNSMSDGLILLDACNHIILKNQAAEPLLGLFVNGGNREIRKCRLNGAADHICQECIRDINRNTACMLVIGNRIYEIMTSLPAEAHEQKMKILLIRDITEREKMYEQQIHQNRLAVLGKTAAVVAHEMNSPLAAISMYNQMMASELPADSSFGEHVDVIDRNTKTCQRIIRDLLDYSRLPEPSYETLDLKNVIVQVGRLLKPVYEKKNIRFEYQFNGQPASIQGDAMQIQQVFVNLVLNAIQAVPENYGRIIIRFVATEKTNRIRIDVEDNGHGIEAALQKKIFEPFFTTKRNQGTGLGLSTAKKIMNAHDGDLHLIGSQPGCTVFRVELPVM